MNGKDIIKLMRLLLLAGLSSVALLISIISCSSTDATATPNTSPLPPVPMDGTTAPVVPGTQIATVTPDTSPWRFVPMGSTRVPATPTVSDLPASDYWRVASQDDLVASTEAASISIHEIVIAPHYTTLFYSIEFLSPDTGISAALPLTTVLITSPSGRELPARDVQAFVYHDGATLGAIAFQAVQPDDTSLTLKVFGLDVQKVSFGPYENISGAWEIPLVTRLKQVEDPNLSWHVRGRSDSDAGKVKRLRSGTIMGVPVLSSQLIGYRFLVADQELVFYVGFDGRPQLLVSTTPMPLTVPTDGEPFDPSKIRQIFGSGLIADY